MYNRYLKRLLDIIGSLVLIIVLSWLFILLALLIKLTSRGKILYKQKRFGKNKKIFSILKFRTMKSSAPGDVPTHLLQDPEEYITGIGKILRKTSLDELPQLFNIIKGDMSIVGPRPALWNQYDLIAERDNNDANDVRPGLTGWAQINGRDELPILLKAHYDGDYVKKMSFLFDMICIFKTVVYVIKHDGVNEGVIEGRNNNEKSINNWG
ncbi:sugar transferase [Clostridium sp. KNHs205]|uniref:sugar transferase n=1 Tax=Clostridium sp. KNHs205 TaxID=1449050 RepID=UPI00051B9B7F|nr:sugar transferase [Clostridium sp. KNHs205]